MRSDQRTTTAVTPNNHSLYNGNPMNNGIHSTTTVDFDINGSNKSSKSPTTGSKSSSTTAIGKLLKRIRSRSKSPHHTQRHMGGGGTTTISPTPSVDQHTIKYNQAVLMSTNSNRQQSSDYNHTNGYEDHHKNGNEDLYSPKVSTTQIAVGHSNHHTATNQGHHQHQQLRCNATDNGAAGAAGGNIEISSTPLTTSRNATTRRSSSKSRIKNWFHHGAGADDHQNNNSSETTTPGTRLPTDDQQHEIAAAGGQGQGGTMKASILVGRDLDGDHNRLSQLKSQTQRAAFSEEDLVSKSLVREITTEINAAGLLPPQMNGLNESLDSNVIISGGLGGGSGGGGVANNTTTPSPLQQYSSVGIAERVRSIVGGINPPSLNSYYSQDSIFVYHQQAANKPPHRAPSYIRVSCALNGYHPRPYRQQQPRLTPTTSMNTTNAGSSPTTPLAYNDAGNRSNNTGPTTTTTTRTSTGLTISSSAAAHFSSTNDGASSPSSSQTMAKSIVERRLDKFQNSPNDSNNFNNKSNSSKHNNNNNNGANNHNNHNKPTIISIVENDRDRQQQQDPSLSLLQSNDDNSNSEQQLETSITSVRQRIEALQQQAAQNSATAAVQPLLSSSEVRRRLSDQHSAIENGLPPKLAPRPPALSPPILPNNNNPIINNGGSGQLDSSGGDLVDCNGHYSHYYGAANNNNNGMDYFGNSDTSEPPAPFPLKLPPPPPPRAQNTVLTSKKQQKNSTVTSTGKTGQGIMVGAESLTKSDVDLNTIHSPATKENPQESQDQANPHFSNGIDKASESGKVQQETTKILPPPSPTIQPDNSSSIIPSTTTTTTTEEELSTSSAAPLDAIGHQKRAEITQNRLKELCTEAEGYLAVPDLSEEAGSLVRLAFGKANLLSGKKFRKFYDLIDKNEVRISKNPIPNDPQPTLLDDLEGYWSIVEMEVEDVNQAFETVRKMAQNGWIVPQEQHEKTSPSRSSKSTNKSPSPAAAANSNNNRKNGNSRSNSRSRLGDGKSPTTSSNSTKTSSAAAQQRQSEARKRLMEAKAQAKKKMLMAQAAAPNHNQQEQQHGAEAASNPETKDSEDNNGRTQDALIFVA